MKFTSLNTTGARRVAISQKILGLPVMAIYKGGEKVEELVKEECTEDAIEAMIQKYIQYTFFLTCLYQISDNKQRNSRKALRYILKNTNWKEGEYTMAILAGKKVIIIGDRDGVPGPAIAECVQTAGGEVVYSSTECFV